MLVGALRLVLDPRLRDRGQRVQDVFRGGVKFPVGVHDGASIRVCARHVVLKRASMRRRRRQL